MRSLAPLRLTENGAPPPWAASYVGIPFRSHGRDHSGCDCYGLVALVLEEVFGLEVPSYAADYLDATDAEEIAALIAGEIRPFRHSERSEESHTTEARDRQWHEISRRARNDSKSSVSPGDAIVLRIAGRAWHVGIVIDPTGWFLHTRPGVDACLERWDALRWARRVIGFYRYAR